MANRTDPAARSIRGTNPQNLVEKIVRGKIYQNTYWKEQCFGLTAETLVDKAMEIDHFGGTFGGNRKPTPFLCLVIKMLQIQPEKEIVVEFIKNEDYKYVRILGAFYLRLTGSVTDVYQYLEPLYNDYRKLRRKLADGKYSLTHVDEVIDELLTTDYSCDVALPRIAKRWTLESTGKLEPRRSALEDDFEEEEEKEDEDNAAAMEIDGFDKDNNRGHSPTRERDRDKRRDSHRHHRDRDYNHYDRDHDRERGRGRDRERDRDRDRHRLRDERDYGRERDRDREREREGRERDRRDRDRDRGRRRSRSRSRSRDRRERDGERDDGDHRRRHRSSASPPRRSDGTEGKEEGKKKKGKKESKDDGTDHPDPEIAEQNRIRAALGLKPLRP